MFWELLFFFYFQELVLEEPYFAGKHTCHVSIHLPKSLFQADKQFRS